MKVSEQANEVAESKFQRKERQLQEGQKAMAEYEASRRAIDAKTSRLRALRLARDAELAAAPPKPKTPAKPKKLAKKPAKALAAKKRSV